MRQAPLPLKFVINFVAYVWYTLLLSIIFSISFPFILTMMWKEVLDPADPIFIKIQISIAVIVFVITIMFRKYFYLTLRKDSDISEEKVEKKVEIKEKQTEMDWLNFDNKSDNKEPEKVVIKEKEYNFSMDADDDDLKIFVDKEIKR